MLNNQPKYLIIIAMLATIIMPCSVITTNKVISIGSQYASAGSLVLPLWFVIGDILTEVYGYRVSRQIFWYAIFCQFIFCFVTFLLIRLPSPTFWHGQASYLLVLGNILHLYLGGITAMIIAGFVNTYIISKWKILTRGKYFWIRTIGSSTIGEAVYTILAFFLMFFGTIPIVQLKFFIFWAYLFKVGYAILFAIPANLLVNYLKKEEGTDVYDYHVNFNPFKI
jgi:hypothetical protein